MKKAIALVVSCLVLAVSVRAVEDDLDKQLEKLRSRIRFKAFKEKYESGQLKERGRRRSLGYVCGREWVEYDGMLEGWYESGAKKCEIPYKGGELDGVALNWFPSGKKKYIVAWKSGKKDGDFTVFYDSDVVSSRGRFSEGSLMVADFFDPSGKKVTREEWLAISGNRPFWN